MLVETADLLPHIARQTQLPAAAVRGTVALLEQGATVPFIARYRQAQTQGLDEEQIRAVQKSLHYHRELAARKQTVLATIAEQGKLTDELRRRIETTTDATELEDLYLPYKPKRKTKATVALEQGLGPLAELMRSLHAAGQDKDALVKPYVTGELCTRKEAVTGAQYILAEQVTEDADVRAWLRNDLQQHGTVLSKLKQADHKEAHKFELYHDFRLGVAQVKPHQYLALQRGEALGILSIGLETDEAAAEARIAKLAGVDDRLLFADECRAAVHLALTRYLLPSIEREVRANLKQAADAHSVKVFASNLRNLLLQPPIAGKVVMGLDPGFASGCKVAVVGPQGEYLAGDVVYPTEPKRDVAGAERKLLDHIARHGVHLIAIGNGTASRETEEFVAGMIRKHRLAVQYLIVSEAGASVYSASEIAKKEFPNLDATQRGNVSIARRVQDPLAELVKIDPKSLGVGMYQHDVDERLLEQELQAVVEQAVNEVGVDVNTASARLLQFVSGLNARMAEAVVAHRQRIGRFSLREELLQVPGVGPKAFELAAGFLRIRGGKHPLDNTGIHPERYGQVAALATQLKTDLAQPQTLGIRLKQLPDAQRRQLGQQLDLDPYTLQLIADNLAKPGRDPREDVPPPILRSDIRRAEDLREGELLKGTVRNVVDFGAFVDIGLKNDALLHVSRMRKPNQRRIQNPLDVVQVGDVLDLRVEKIDREKGRISLAMA